ncbi:hypothetical protein ACT80S_18455 [Ramlibacter sp. MAHUQ-53]|uniref:hypothetical protein n=1 Tax=unclassified Ramlibacter TaxID=2617605 RepID=UPI003634409D
MTDPVVEQVRQKLLSRSQAGILKYGTTLERPDLFMVDWLTHLQEELLDAANYIQVCINKIEGAEE